MIRVFQMAPSINTYIGENRLTDRDGAESSFYAGITHRPEGRRAGLTFIQAAGILVAL